MLRSKSRPLKPLVATVKGRQILRSFPANKGRRNRKMRIKKRPKNKK
ncbi:hypothetical protein ES703_120170 [subsurface metagenome]